MTEGNKINEHYHYISIFLSEKYRFDLGIQILNTFQASLLDIIFSDNHYPNLSSF